MEEKLERLKSLLKELGKVSVAYSGGVDSTFLLKVSKEVLKDNVLAVTLVSPLFPKKEIEEAKKMAETLGVKHIIVEDDSILQNPEFINNPPERCYICKKINFKKILEISKENNIEYVIEGSNADDLKDYRPGRLAIKELGIRSPLLEIGLTKSEIRKLSQMFGLPTYDKPSLACLATRIPYGEKIEKERLKRIELSEEFIRSLGIRQVRVRDHNNIARIEIEDKDFYLIISLKDKIIKELKRLGYKYITLDLEGYRTGSMNEEIIKREGELYFSPSLYSTPISLCLL